MNGRDNAFRLKQSMRLKLAAKVREVLEKDPTINVKELVRRTGATYDMCNFLRKQMKAKALAAELHR